MAAEREPNPRVSKGLDRAGAGKKATVKTSMNNVATGGGVPVCPREDRTFCFMQASNS